MIVKIIKARFPRAVWYSELMGLEFEVNDTVKDGAYTLTASDVHQIDESDCVIVDPKPKKLNDKLRDKIAIAAMKSMLLNSTYLDMKNEKLAELSYNYADAMLKVRSKK